VLYVGTGDGGFILKPDRSITQRKMTESVIVQWDIVVKVDGVKFNMEIDPQGNYVLYGPHWNERRDAPLFAHGKLRAAVLFPGLAKSIAEVIRVKLKS
jgi:hypothetical protein